MQITAFFTPLPTNDLILSTQHATFVHTNNFLAIADFETYFLLDTLLQ
jgi:hypothetical protein